MAASLVLAEGTGFTRLIRCEDGSAAPAWCLNAAAAPRGFSSDFSWNSSLMRTVNMNPV